MADDYLFFVVEYMPDAYGATVQELYRQTRGAFIREFEKAQEADGFGRPRPQDYAVDVLTRRIVSSDATLIDFDYDAGNLAETSKLDLADLDIASFSQRDEIDADTLHDYPHVEALRSRHQRFWGTATVLEGLDTPSQKHLIRCLIRAIFYPYQEPTTSSERCTEFKGMMVSQTADGLHIKGVFRWSAWQLNSTNGAIGQPFQRWVGNGAGGGDHRT